MLQKFLLQNYTLLRVPGCICSNTFDIEKLTQQQNLLILCIFNKLFNLIFDFENTFATYLTKI